MDNRRIQMLKLRRRAIVDQLISTVEDTRGRDIVDPIVVSLFSQARRCFTERQQTYLRAWWYSHRARNTWHQCSTETLLKWQAEFREKLQVEEATNEKSTLQEPLTGIAICSSLYAIGRLLQTRERQA